MGPALDILATHLTAAFGIDQRDMTPRDCLIVRIVSDIVSTRAARLTACTVAAIFREKGEEKTIHIGVDGSLYELYPGFQLKIRTALKEILGKGESLVKINFVKDGSGVGAALAALGAEKLSVGHSLSKMGLS